MLFILFPPRIRLDFLSTCPGIVTCDRPVTNSEPLGYSCPHDARLVLFGTMLHQTLKLFQLHTNTVVFFFTICRRETLYFSKIRELGAFLLDLKNQKTCEILYSVPISEGIDVDEFDT